MRIPASSRPTPAARRLCASTPSRARPTCSRRAYSIPYLLEGYGLLNGRVRYASADGSWELSLFGNNLTDEVYGSYAGRFGGAYWDTPTGVPAVAAPGAFGARYYARPAARIRHLVPVQLRRWRCNGWTLIRISRGKRCVFASWALAFGWCCVFRPLLRRRPS